LKADAEAAMELPGLKNRKWFVTNSFKEEKVKQAVAGKTVSLHMKDR
jgi:hypothetical protein